MRKKKTSPKFSWKNHFKETLQENKKFFIAIIAFMAISIALGVAKAVFIKPPNPCQQKVTQAIEKKVVTADLNCKYK